MPTTLTVADFLSLRMQYKAEQAENEIPAVIEHNFKDGRMVDHYFVVPGPALLADEAVQDFGGKIENILFLQQSEPGAPWQVLLHEPSMIREITFEMPEEEFRAMLAKNNLILPGRPRLCDAISSRVYLIRPKFSLFLLFSDMPLSSAKFCGIKVSFFCLFCRLPTCIARQMRI